MILSFIYRSYGTRYILCMNYPSLHHAYGPVKHWFPLVDVVIVVGGSPVAAQVITQDDLVVNTHSRNKYCSYTR